MNTLYLCLYIASAVLFLAAAINSLVARPTRLNLTALALLAWVLVPLIQQARAQ